MRAMITRIDQPPVPVQVDGEILGALPAEITLHPQRSLANGRSRRMVHWNRLGAGMLADCDLATKSRRD
jgi:hypothetical protein